MRFNIQAKLPDGASPDQAPEMLQALLADRFKVTLHRESKDFQAYALVVAKGGSKLVSIGAIKVAMNQSQMRSRQGPQDGSAADPGDVDLSGLLQTMGLKLEARKLPLPLLVIDHAEKTPTANYREPFFILRAIRNASSSV